MEAVIRKGRINEKDYSLEIIPVKIKVVEHENIVDKISGKLILKQEIIDELFDNEETYNPEVF
jgi:hypothetical protein